MNALWIDAVSKKPNTPPMGTVLCVDPAKASAAWARLTHAGVLECCGLTTWDSFAGPFTPPAAWIGIDALVMEWPQVYTTGATDAHDLLALTFTLGRVCAITGAGQALTVHPHGWKGNAPKAVHHARLMEQIPHGWRAALADGCQGHKASLHHNIRDAVGLAWWVHMMRSL